MHYKLYDTTYLQIQIIQIYIYLLDDYHETKVLKILFSIRINKENRIFWISIRAQSRKINLERDIDSEFSGVFLYSPRQKRKSEFLSKISLDLKLNTRRRMRKLCISWWKVGVEANKLSNQNQYTPITYGITKELCKIKWKN